MDGLVRSPLKAVLDDTWAFMRPHTIFGTTLAVSAITASALLAVHAPLVTYLPYAFALWVCYLLTNVYVVGLNQITDVEIDRVNKPYLPIAAGHLSVERATTIVLICMGTALVIALFLGPIVLTTVVVSLIIGTAYSLPPVRLKHSPLFAALSIITVRAVLINVSSYLYWNSVFSSDLKLGALIFILTVFMVMVVTVIAVYKDLPDITGDVLYGVRTLPSRIGRLSVMRLALGLLTAAYLWAIGAGVLLKPPINVLVFVIGHAVVLAVMIWRSRAVDLHNEASVTSFYLFIWQLLYLEYLIIPLVVFLH